MRKDIEFNGHGGTVLRGWLYLPDNVTGPVPGIVMTQGLSATMAMGLDPFAAVFAASGMAVLAYDHRTLGCSDGEPRQVINPWEQMRDYRLAITWLSEQAQIDAGRIGVWGNSFSGGEAIVLGACDSRVKAVVANVPMAGFDGVDYTDTDDMYDAMRTTVFDDSGNGLADKVQSSIGPMKVVKERDDDKALLGKREASEWFLSEGNKDGAYWQNTATMVNCMIPGSLWDPGFCVAHVSAPLMMVVATEDTLCPTQVAKDSFERASEPKELVMIDGHHFSPNDESVFKVAAESNCRFFKQYLNIKI